MEAMQPGYFMPLIGTFTRYETTIDIEVKDIDDHESGNKTANGGELAGGGHGLWQHCEGERAQQHAAGQTCRDRQEKRPGTYP